MLSAIAFDVRRLNAADLRRSRPSTQPPRRLKTVLEIAAVVLLAGALTVGVAAATTSFYGFLERTIFTAADTVARACGARRAAPVPQEQRRPQLL